MRSLHRCGFALSLCSVFLIFAFTSEPAYSDQPTVFLIKVVFKEVDFIRAGDVAHYTSRNQTIGFKVFPTELVNGPNSVQTPRALI